MAKNGFDSDGMSPVKQFEYLMWMKERLFELIKMNFFIITAVAAVAPLVVEFTDVVLSDLTNNRSMILGVVSWIATLFLIVHFILLSIRSLCSGMLRWICMHPTNPSRLLTNHCRISILSLV